MATCSACPNLICPICKKPEVELNKGQKGTSCSVCGGYKTGNIAEAKWNIKANRVSQFDEKYNCNMWYSKCLNCNTWFPTDNSKSMKINIKDLQKVEKIELLNPKNEKINDFDIFKVR
jgi:hypothetical protein